MYKLANQKKKILKMAKEIASTIQKRCVSSDGFVMSTFDAINWRFIDRGVNPDDIADYLLFMVWLGKITNDKQLIAWSKRQVRLQRKTLQMPSGLFFSGYKADNKHPFKTNLRRIYVRFQEDFPMGILPIYSLTGDGYFLNVAENFFEGLAKNCISKNGFVYDHVIPALKIPFPLSASESSGLFMEGFVDMFKITKDEKYLAAAKKIAHAWTNTKTFKAQGFFPDRWNVFVGKPASPWSRLMKTNTNMLFGLLSLYEQTKSSEIKKSIYPWLKSSEKMEYKTGVFYRSWNIEKKSPERLVDKTMNHAILDVFLEVYRMFDEKRYLRKAEKGGRWWLKRQQVTGLIPDGIEGQENYSSSMIDSHADLSIIFLKLYQITKKDKFMLGALKSLDGFKHFKKGKDNWVGWVNPFTGETVNPENKTKFLGGVLKSLLVTHQVLDGKNFYKDEMFRKLARDR